VRGAKEKQATPQAAFVFPAPLNEKASGSSEGASRGKAAKQRAFEL